MNCDFEGGFWFAAGKTAFGLTAVLFIMAFAVVIVCIQDVLKTRKVRK